MAIDLHTLNGGTATPKPSVAEAKDNQKAQAGSVASPATSATEQARGGDNVQITSRARELQGLIGRLSRESAFDSEKVERLRAEIGSGRYSVDSQRVASRLLDLERDLSR